MTTVRPSIVILSVFLQGAQAASAAGDASVTASAQMRRDEIARVQESLGDPDPLARLANMEAIVASGDGLKIEVALRTALTSDDEQLRGLAMQAYIARAKRITFDIVLPDEQQRLYDAATADPAKLDEVTAKYRWARIVAANAGKVVITVVDYKFGDNVGTFQMQRPEPFNIDGDRFSAPITLNAFGSAYGCYVEFRPTNKATFQGTLACAGGLPKLAVSARAF